MKTPSEILTDAADLIERDGWRQGRGSQGQCATSAIWEANRTEGIPKTAQAHAETEALSALRDVINRHAIPKWNDGPGRTKEEVVSALREAARRAAT